MRLPPVKRALKKLLPTSLFARALLILLVPLIALQALVAHIFYDRHWDSVVRNMSGAVAADIGLLVNEYDREYALYGRAEALEQTQRMGKQLGIAVTRSPLAVDARAVRKARRHYRDLYEGLSDPNQPRLMAIDRVDSGQILLRVMGDHDPLAFTFSRKRLASSTTHIFIFWMLGAAALLMVIATLFLRNQIKPIVQLARAAEQFGLGQEIVEVSSRGASEVKRAASAFRTMADRIRRTVSSRTEMLAGISHDLRTPLTRMKLELEMGKIDTATRDALEADIEEMRRMIDEYLDFARGDAGEPMERMDVAALVRDVVETYARQHRAVSLGHCDRAELMLRPQAIRRTLTNLIDNALRYGKSARVELEQTLAFVRIRVVDKGPGIPDDEHETVFKPFTRLEDSRNVKTGGVGLGLSIARDIAQGHGGSITLENQKDANGATTGLCVILRLPREVNG